MSLSAVELRHLLVYLKLEDQHNFKANIQSVKNFLKNAPPQSNSPSQTHHFTSVPNLSRIYIAKTSPRRIFRSKRSLSHGANPSPPFPQRSPPSNEKSRRYHWRDPSGVGSSQTA